MGSAVVLRTSSTVFKLSVLVLLLFQSTYAYSPQLTRRGWMSKSNAMVFSTTFISQAREANALEKRNEALCGTGFFTNIAQYKCTEIGDISGDGKAKEMSKEEESLSDSLMGKLALDDSASLVPGNNSEDNGKRSESQGKFND